MWVKQLLPQCVSMLLCPMAESRCPGLHRVGLIASVRQCLRCGQTGGIPSTAHGGGGYAPGGVGGLFAVLFAVGVGCLLWAASAGALVSWPVVLMTLSGHAYHRMATRRNVLPCLMKRSLTKMAQECRPSPLQSPSSACVAFGHAFGDCWRVRSMAFRVLATGLKTLVGHSPSRPKLARSCRTSS
jgi:hypothetical protein